jgi:hypothetical protein
MIKELLNKLKRVFAPAPSSSLLRRQTDAGGMDRSGAIHSKALERDSDAGKSDR